MKICFINPPFKTEYGRFSRESRSPCIGHSRILYYPLWLIYAAAVCEREGFDVDFIDACAWELNLVRTMARVREKSADARLFVLDTSTPSITSDVRFGAALKEIYPDAFVLLVGTHPSATVDETLAAMKGMISVHHMLQAANPVKRWVVLTGMRVAGKYEFMHGLVANPQPNPQCTESNRKLDALYAKALPLAERLILEYVAKLDTDEPLDAAYDHTFG